MHIVSDRVFLYLLQPQTPSFYIWEKTYLHGAFIDAWYGSEEYRSRIVNFKCVSEPYYLYTPAKHLIHF